VAAGEFRKNPKSKVKEKSVILAGLVWSNADVRNCWREYPQNFIPRAVTTVFPLAH
jgi:hypothetical protein